MNQAWSVVFKYVRFVQAFHKKGFQTVYNRQIISGDWSVKKWYGLLRQEARVYGLFHKLSETSVKAAVIFCLSAAMEIRIASCKQKNVLTY